MKALLLKWREGIILTLVLFAINVGGRIAAKVVKAATEVELEKKQSLLGFITMGVLFLVFFGVTLAWGRSRSIAKVAMSVGFPAAAACLLNMFISPLVVGDSPFDAGWGAFFANIWILGGLAIAGVGLGLIALIAFGADYRAKQLKNFAERTKAQPRRV
ncbi:hypothetical protein [Catelliglobosispora koreensis]|uniref:hypothetical protein n=1 Tax=Catelliglobosispora koreensis TaxID=129052 RepID=UPI0003765197|nr:hypothetical protein [Catelliglobosispora koreensis]